MLLRLFSEEPTAALLFLVPEKDIFHFPFISQVAQHILFSKKNNKSNLQLALDLGCICASFGLNALQF